MKYRKKPLIIEATQWWHDGGSPRVNLYRGYQKVCLHCTQPMKSHGWIDTLEGGHIVCPGDWIITGVKKEVYPCKPDVFAVTYEPVDEAEALR